LTADVKSAGSPVGLRIIAVVVVLTALTHGIQAILGVLPGDDPRPLVVEHIIVCVLGLAAGYALWRGQQRAPLLLAIYGIAIAILIVSLGPLLGLMGAARKGLWTGATMLLLLTVVAVRYAGRRVRQPA
jgi:hypothetical protein